MSIIISPPLTELIAFVYQVPGSIIGLVFDLMVFGLTFYRTAWIQMRQMKTANVKSDLMGLLARDGALIHSFLHLRVEVYRLFFQAHCILGKLFSLSISHHAQRKTDQSRDIRVLSILRISVILTTTVSLCTTLACYWFSFQLISSLDFFNSTFKLVYTD